MALEMRTKCEKCKGTLAPDGLAFICIYECTYCETCTRILAGVCPNCKGELVPRPRPKMHRVTAKMGA